MTAVENTPDVESMNGVVESADEPTVEETAKDRYFALVKATWKLAYRLAFDDGIFCSEGTNEYLTAFDLPTLVHTDGNDELKDNYLTAWLQWSHWAVAGDDEAHFDAARGRLARSIRTRLQREEPKSVAVMNGWLRELGLDEITPPVVRHTGRYDVAYNETTQVNSARIQEALRERFPELDVRVSYVGRV